MKRVYRKRGLLVLAFGLWPMQLGAETDGPDSAGLILIDSVESDGPPHGWIDMTDSVDVDPGPVDLPFGFSMGDGVFEAVVLGLDGTLTFDGTPGDCPGDGPWSGFLTGSDSSRVRFKELGRYPSRGLVWDWESAQLLLLERRSEGVIHTAMPTGVSGLGAQAGSGSGVVWACDDIGRLAERSAWISNAATRSVAGHRSTDHLSQAWWGTEAAEFFGESVAVGDVNEDGLDDVLISQPEWIECIFSMAENVTG